MGVVLVRFKPQVSYDDIKALLDKLDARVMDHAGHICQWTLWVPDENGTRVLRSIDFLKNSGLIEWAEPDYIFNAHNY